MTFCVRSADPEEVDILTNLVIRSKFYWGYDTKYRASLETILAVSREKASIGDCWVAEAETGDPVAVCQFDSSASPPHLDLLFVEPAYIGQGVGSLLFDTLTEHARLRGITQFNLDADPNAAAFYMAKGGRVIGERESRIVRGQLLPIIEFIL